MTDQQSAEPLPTTPAPATPPATKLTISSADLASTSVDERVSQLREAATPQVVRQVGTPTAQSQPNFFRGPVPFQALAGLVGGLVGWVLSEAVMRPDAVDGPFSDNQALWSAVFMTLFAAGLAGVLSAWEGMELRSSEKAIAGLKRTLPVAIGLALVGGFLAQAIWEPLAEGAFARAELEADSFEEYISMVEGALRIPRALAILAAGAAVGLGLGLASGAKKRAVNGLIGGAVGGFVGGLAFSFVATGPAARAVTLTITGVAVAAGIALVEQARKDLWLEIVTGGMAGKQFIIYHDRTLIGSSPHCGVTLIKDPGIAPEHAELLRTPRGTVIRQAGQQPVVVNGRPVSEHQLADGDQVQVGSTVVRFATKEQAMPTFTEAF